MKKIKFALSLVFIAFFLSVIFISCRKEKMVTDGPLQQEPVLPAIPYPYSDKHHVHDHLATLGRVLFYDKNLSVNNKVSCGSCHKQEFAFADNVRFNKGFNGVDLKRNSPSIQGIRGFRTDSQIMNSNPNNTTTPINPPIVLTTFPNEFNQLPVVLFWDGRQQNVADMVLNPVLNHNEMNIPDFASLIDKVKSTSYYPALFKNAFGDESITKEKIAFALEGFIACLNTDPNQKNLFSNQFSNQFDPFSPAPPPPFEELKTIEEQGEFLFHNKYNCAKCHDSDPSNPGGYGTVTSPSQMFNIGLDEVYADNGLGAITKRGGDLGVFKVPTLKNISLTAPYMHDGRFSNLGEVIDHYSHGIKPNANLSFQFLNADGTPKKLNIQPAEKKALIAFLNTLRDDDFLTSPLYSDPFK